VDAFLLRNPVCLKIYIDDITMRATQPTEVEVLNVLDMAAKEMKIVVVQKLKCSIAVEKAAVVASTKSLADSIRNKLGSLGGVSFRSIPNLGVDFSAGRRRGRLLQGTVRGRRFNKGLARRKQLTTLRRILGPRIASNVFSSGVLPSIAYGAEVNGVSDKEHAILQRIATSAQSNGSGRSLSATLAIRGDSTWQASVAPCLKWQQEIWRACNGSVGGAHLSMDELHAMWSAGTTVQYRLYRD